MKHRIFNCDLNRLHPYDPRDHITPRLIEASRNRTPVAAVYYAATFRRDPDGRNGGVATACWDLPDGTQHGPTVRVYVVNLGDPGPS